MKIDPEVQSEIIRPFIIILKGVLIVSTVAFASGWTANSIGKVPVIIVALVVAARFGLSIIATLSKHNKEDRDANPEMDLHRPWTHEELELRRQENDRALGHGFFLFLCVMVVYALLG